MSPSRDCSHNSTQTSFDTAKIITPPHYFPLVLLRHISSARPPFTAACIKRARANHTFLSAPPSNQRLGETVGTKRGRSSLTAGAVPTRRGICWRSPKTRTHQHHTAITLNTVLQRSRSSCSCLSHAVELGLTILLIHH